MQLKHKLLFSFTLKSYISTNNKHKKYANMHMGTTVTVQTVYTKLYDKPTVDYDDLDLLFGRDFMDWLKK